MSDPQMQIRLLRESDGSYEPLDGVPALELNRVITDAALTSIGGGFGRTNGPLDFRDWYLEYDEVIFVLEGRMTVLSGDEVVDAGPGEAILLPKGATVTYQADESYRGFYVLHPIDWAERRPSQ